MQKLNLDQSCCLSAESRVHAHCSAHTNLIESFQHAQVGDQQNDYHQFSVCKIHPSHAEHHRARLQLPNSRSNKMLTEDQMIAKIDNYGAINHVT